MTGSCPAFQLMAYDPKTQTTLIIGANLSAEPSRGADAATELAKAAMGCFTALQWSRPEIRRQRTEGCSGFNQSVRTERPARSQLSGRKPTSADSYRRGSAPQHSDPTTAMGSTPV